MTKFKKNILLVAMAPLLAGITGCSVEVAERLDKQIDNTKDKTSAGISGGIVSEKHPSSVSMKDEVYIAGGAFKLSEREMLPKAFTKQVAFNQVSAVSFQEMIAMISSDLGIRVVVSDDAVSFLSDDAGGEGGDEGGSGGSGGMVFGMDEVFDSEGPGGNGSSSFTPPSEGEGLLGSNISFKLNYKGDYSGLLDAVTAKANLFWKWENNEVSIFRQETRIFTFDGDTTVGAFSASVSSEISSEGDDDGASANTSSKSSFLMDNDSVFDDVIEAIKSMVTETGKFSVSANTGNITVTDTPRVLSNIDSYLKKMNEDVTKRIAVRAEVYEIASDEEGNFGVDWAALYSGSSRFNFNLDTSLSNATQPAIKFGIIDPGSNFSGTKAFIDMLNKMSKVSLVTSSSVFTTNGQVAPVQIADEVHYLKQVTSEQTENGTSFSMEPGSVLSGFTMMINPRITSKGDISMRFSVDMSQLNELKDFSIGENMIQLPNKTSKNFVQQVIMNSGKTMMIAGFERIEKSTDVASLGSKGAWMFGGKKGGSERKIMTMILLTPYIMNN